ncbi:DUF2892 domain-containing protein [Patescibacteria group bacterium]
MKNESKSDRLLRVVLGAVFIMLAYTQLEGGLMIIGYIIGIILLVTAATGFCAIYKLLGINTHHEGTEQE